MPRIEPRSSRPSSVVRASLAQSATSIAALARCQGSPLARLTAWMERCSSTTRERRRLLFNQPLPSPLDHSCAKLTQRAPVTPGKSAGEAPGWREG